jgi:hypothetical protein
VGLTRPQQLTSLPVDAMQEFRVIANNYSAEYGHSTGGIVTMSTRAGTNELHGSLWENLRNSATDANSFFTNRAGQEKPAFRYNHFGASTGGPVVLPKMYDGRNRVIVAANFNMDVGDAWEHADWPIYPEAMTALAYRFGINYIIYAMTH